MLHLKRRVFSQNQKLKWQRWFFITSILSLLHCLYEEYGNGVYLLQIWLEEFKQNFHSKL